MADQHNANIPALANTIASDVPKIKENLEFHKDALERIFKTWSDTDNSAAVFNSAVGFSDGTYTYSFPTNGVAAHSKIMLGTSSTIIWMYLDAAPPGWKVLATGADMVLAVKGGSAAYNVNGGNPDSVAAWAVSGLTADAHTHAGPSHTHTLSAHTHTGPSHMHAGPIHTHDVVIPITGYGGSSAGGIQSGYMQTDNSGNMYHATTQPTATSSAAGDGITGASGTGASGAPSSDTTGAGGTGNTGAASATGVSSTGAWRPKASVGRLFQLDTAP